MLMRFISWRWILKETRNGDNTWRPVTDRSQVNMDGAGINVNASQFSQLY